MAFSMKLAGYAGLVILHAKLARCAKLGAYLVLILCNIQMLLNSSVANAGTAFLLVLLPCVRDAIYCARSAWKVPRSAWSAYLGTTEILLITPALYAATGTSLTRLINCATSVLPTVLGALWKLGTALTRRFT